MWHELRECMGPLSVEVRFICVPRVKNHTISENCESVWIREPCILQEIAFCRELLLDLLLWVISIEATLI
jgi:hypothetical protein